MVSIITHEVQSHEEKRSGLTVSVGGSVVSSLNTAQQLGKKAHNRQSSALSAFEYGELVNAAKHAYNDVKAYKSLQPMRLLDNEKAVLNSAAERNISYRLATHDFDGIDPAVESVQNKQNAYKVQQAKGDRLFNIKAGIGSSQYKQTSELDQAQYVGSSIGSNAKVTVTGTGETPNTGNVHITGSTIDAPEVHINAKNNIRLDAGRNTSIQTNDYTQSGWSVGATISPHGNGVIGLDANVFNGKEKGVETLTTHAGTVIRGRQLATATSGNNTDILGSKITGNTVVTNAGNDLRIESLQDIHDYHKNSRNKSLSVSYGMSGPALVGFENGKGTTDSHYASVTDQAGIYTGEGGYHVQVGNATTLTGGIIKGSPDTSKNKLSSKSLEMKDIQNEAFYSAKTSGYSLSTTKRTKNNPLGITGSPNMGIPVKGSAKSTTHSAISEGIIELAEKESLDKINHDTEHALNKLAPIFDKKKVEEKQILLTKISNQGYKLIGDIALKKSRDLTIKAIEASRDGNEKLAQEYIKEAKRWNENGVYRIALHAGFGGVISAWSGNGAISGVKGSTLNIVLNNSLKDIKDPGIRKIVSLAALRTFSVNNVGQSIALSATDNNWLTHEEQQEMLTELTGAFTYDEGYSRNKRIAEIIGKWAGLSNYRAVHGLGDDNDQNEIIDGSVAYALASWLPDESVLNGGLNYTLMYLAGLNRTSADVAYSTRSNLERENSSWEPNAWISTVYASDDPYYSNNNPYARVYENYGDELVDNGHKAITLADGNNAVFDVNTDKFEYTTKPAVYSFSQFGDYMADNGYQVYPASGDMTMNYIIYEGKAFAANRKSSYEIASPMYNRATSFEGKTSAELPHGTEVSASLIGYGAIRNDSVDGVTGALGIDVGVRDFIKNPFDKKSKNDGADNIFSLPKKPSLSISDNNIFSSDFNHPHIKVYYKTLTIDNKPLRTGKLDVVDYTINKSFYNDLVNLHFPKNNMKQRTFNYGEGATDLRLRISQDFKVPSVNTHEVNESINERYGYQPRINQMAISYQKLHPNEGRLYYSNNDPSYIYFVRENKYGGKELLIDKEKFILIPSEIFKQDFNEIQRSY